MKKAKLYNVEVWTQDGNYYSWQKEYSGTLNQITASAQRKHRNWTEVSVEVVK